MHENYEFTMESGANASKDVTVYALSTCGFCRRGLQFLRDHDIAFKFIYVDKLSRDERFKIKRDLQDKYNERVAFPFLIIDGEVIVGFREERWKEAFGV
ncbi:MAG: glutaredoxin [Candidatus Heimdallarchaeota archaeon]|nr:glutaredoxin [Candidatus Heimdallarchaeota archaeon]